jgi:hypothetical protein
MELKNNANNIEKMELKNNANNIKETEFSKTPT